MKNFAGILRVFAKAAASGFFPSAFGSCGGGKVDVLLALS